MAAKAKHAPVIEPKPNRKPKGGRPSKAENFVSRYAA